MNWHTRSQHVLAAALLLGACAVVAGWALAQFDRSAEADAPHAGLDFAIGVDTNGDGTNDCGTGVPSDVGTGAGQPGEPGTPAAEVTTTVCPNTTGELQVNVYLMTSGGLAYEAAAAHVYYTGAITSNGIGASLWFCHTFDASFSGPGFENAGSTIGLTAPCNVGQTNLGLMNRFSFTCSGAGAIRIGHGEGETLVQAELSEHRAAGPDELGVCGAVLEPTATPTEGGPTSTPTNTPRPTNTPAPTNTPSPTVTPAATATPTRTRTPTITPTSTPSATATRRRPMGLGDVNGDGFITALDALWVLQYDARLIADLPIPEAADMNGDGFANALDAQFILWVDGGIIVAP